MHTIEPARLKPGVGARRHPDAQPRRGRRPDDDRLIRGRALIFWDPKSADAEEARRDRHRSDHAGGRLRVGEPRDARRALEGGIVPLPDARLPRARASRRDVRHRRRSLRHRLVARDEPGRPQGRGRGSRPGDGRRLRPQHGRHLPPQRLQPRPARGPEPRGGGRRAGRRRAHVRSASRAQLAQRDAGARRYEPVPLSPKEEEIRRSGGIFAVGRREFRRVGRDRRRRSTGPTPTPRARHDDDRADHLGAPRRQGADGRGLQARDDAARLRRSAAGVGRHGAVLDPHLQPDHRRQHDLSAPGGDRQRSLRLHRQRDRRQADRHRPRVRARAGAWRSRTTRRPATASSISTFPSRGW